jgi:type I restriction enzyme S subunit
VARAETQTGGRNATAAIIPGDRCISVGKPLRDAPDGWSWQKLTDLARLESGHTPSRKIPEYWGGDVPWISTRDATGNHGREIFTTAESTNELGIANSSARICPAGTICLSRTASVGYVVKMGRPMATSQDFVNWVCGEGLNPDFLRYALLSETRALRMFAVGSVHPTIYFPEVKAFHLCAPSRAEQDRIVAILKPLDDKIEHNRSMNENLEATAEVMFKDWFVNYGPTRAKSERRAAYLSFETWALFPDQLDKDGRPSGWDIGRLDDLLVLQRGFDLPAPQRMDGPYPVIAASGINGTHSERMVCGPGVTTGRSGVLGRVFYIQSDFWPLNTSLWVKEFKRSSPLHAYFTLRNIDLEGFNAGSAVPTLNRNHVHSLPHVLPPRAIVAEFEKVALPLMQRLAANERENETLAAIREALIPQLMSGELRIREAEAMVAVAA